MKKILIACVAVIAIGAAAFFFLQKQRQDAVRAFVAGLPGKLTVESVSACPFSDTVTLKNITGSLRVVNNDELELSLGLLRLKGLNAKALDGQGRVRLADRVELEKCLFTAPENSRALLGYSRTSLDRWEAKDVEADPQAFARAYADGAGEEAFFSALTTVAVKDAVWINTAAQGRIENLWPELVELELAAEGDFSVTCAYSETDYYSLPEMGKGLIRDAHFVFGDVKADMSEMSYQGMRIPEKLLIGLYGDTLNLEDDPAALLDLYAEGFRIDGLKAEKLRFTMPDKEPLEVAGLGLSMNLEPGELRIAMESMDVALPARWIAALADEPEVVAPVLGDTVYHFFSKHELVSKTTENGLVRITYKEEIREDSLTRLSDSCSLLGRQMPGPLPCLPAGIFDLALEKAELEWADTGLIGLFYTLAGAEMSAALKSGGSPAEAGKMLREQQVRELRDAPLPEGSPWQPLKHNVAAFMEQGGTLKLSFNPPEPMPVLRLMLGAQAIPELSIESSHTP